MEKYSNQSSSLVRLRCYKFRVSGFNPATCFAWYIRWGLLSNFTFNLRCCCSTPRVLFNRVATLLLPVFYHEEKQVIHFFGGIAGLHFSRFCDSSISIIDNFCQEAVPLQKGCQFRNCSLQNELWNKPIHAAI